MNFKGIETIGGVIQLVNVSAVCGPKQPRLEFEAPGRRFVRVEFATKDKPVGLGIEALDGRWMLERQSGHLASRGDVGLRAWRGDNGAMDQDVAALILKQMAYFAAVREKDGVKAAEIRGPVTRRDLIPHEPQSIQASINQMEAMPTEDWSEKQLDMYAALNGVTFGAQWNAKKKLDHLRVVIGTLIRTRYPIIPLPSDKDIYAQQLPAA